MNQPIKAYIFDMDGTLVDNCSYHVTSWQKFSKAHGNALSKKQILDWMGAQGELMGVEPSLCRVYEDAVNGIGAAREYPPPKAPRSGRLRGVRG